MDGKRLKRFSPAQILLAVAAFLIPIIGGQVQTEAQPLAPGFGSLLVSVLGGPFLQGMETPLLSHFVLGLLIACATVAVLMRRSVLQLPNVKLIGLLIGFFGMLVLSVGMSAFRFVSMATLSEWLIYALAFFTVVAATGRQSGPRLLVSCLYAGVVLIALYGIRFEYLPISGTDPTYRIFAGWINPNATAGILTIGMLLGFTVGSGQSRGIALIVGICNALIGLALILTGSKAGFGALLVGIVVFLVLAVVWSTSNALRARRIGLVVAIVFASILLNFGLQMKNAAAHSKGPAAPLGRVASYSSTSEQSWTFRKLLWKGSLQIVKENPVGYGVGTYRYEGSRPGLTTLTQLAHENLLQLAVEASPLAPIFLVAAVIFWLILMFRGARSMPDESNLLRAGIVAAVVSVFAQGLFESNLYYFGIGLTTFILMGLGLNLSADSVIPEFTPRGARTAFALLASLPILLIGYAGYAEWMRAEIKYAIDNRQIADAQQLAESLVGFAPEDGEAWYLYSILSPQHRGDAIVRASELCPSPRVFRGLATWYEHEEKYTSALDAVRQALIRDPNNLPALRIGLQIGEEMKDTAQAEQFAQRMVDVESTPYFQIRSLPQFVETTTCDARRYLAAHETDPKKKAKLLEGALDIYVQYAQVTVPVVKQYTAEGGSFAGENIPTAIEKCKAGLETAKSLQEVYGLPEVPTSTDVAGGVKVLEGALDSLASK